MKTYNQDYYVQGKQNYRLSRVFQPWLTLLYFWRVQVTLARLPHFSKTERRALDVGAGRGEFLFYLRQRGWQVVGTQISHQAITVAKQYYDLDLLGTNLPVARELGKFDLITYWHVFEHLENPAEHLAEVRELLRDDQSVLIIEVPNPESLGAALCYNAWLGSDPQNHINMLPLSTLCKMILAAHLEIFRLDFFSAKFTLIYLYTALCGWLSGAYLDFDYFMDLLKRPGATLLSPQLAKTFLLILISPFAIIAALFLTPIGIWLKRPETVRVYAKLGNNEG